MAQRSIYFACLALGAFALAGCGSDDDDDGDSNINGGAAGVLTRKTGGSRSWATGGTRPTDGPGGSQESGAGGMSGERGISSTGGLDQQTGGTSGSDAGGSAGGAGRSGVGGAPANVGGAGEAGGTAGERSTEQGGQGGSRSATHGGAAGTSVGVSGAGGEAPSACAPLCGDATCSAGEPDCLPDVFDFAPGQQLPVCLAAGTDSTGITWCGEPACPDGETGCPFVVHVGTVDWSLSPGTTPVHTDVAVSATITAIDGNLTASLDAVGSCDFVVDIPDPVPISATGALQPGAATDLLSLSFSAVDVSLAGVELSASATSENPLLCGLAAGELDPTDYESDFAAGVLEAIQAQAATLTCLDCRPSCSEGIACTAE